ncbi:MAG: HlyD family type I secretion periplasmic adaptor subunit [Dinoroseobacter sp.]|nr:HlyD family type I secretion periplasmic adaptor subunit [Dinoroseobacter sp.]
MTSRVNSRLPLSLGYAAVLILIAGFGAWSIGTEIAGAVVARGQIEVQSERQIVQHPDGGVVGEILAKDGDVVNQGDVLIRLDDTYMVSELDSIEKQLVEFRSRGARLVAELNGAEELSMPDLSEYRQPSPEWIDAHVSGQKDLFAARKQTLTEELQQIDEELLQIDEEIKGDDAQLAALNTNLELASGERASLESLLERGLVQAGRVLEMKTNEAELQGQIGLLTSQRAQAGRQKAELSIRQLGLVDTRREEEITQLRDLEYSRIQLEEERTKLLEQLSRLEVRAPVSGVVFSSKVYTIGSVIPPADIMMSIVPQEQPLQVATRVQPNDIEEVHHGQAVDLKFTAFSSRTIPSLPGKVVRISADAETDPATGFSYYEAIVEPDAAALLEQPDVDLLPGMPVEVFLKTEDRTPISYLLNPLTAYFGRALR